MTAPVVRHADPGDETPAAFSPNKFLLVVVACQRAAQLRAGARPHLEARGHKSCTMAVAEVMAGTVAYSVV